MARHRKASSPVVPSKPARAASRRELLKGSLAGLAAGSTALAAIPAKAEQPPPADPADLQFQETDHVRTFYDLARR